MKLKDNKWAKYILGSIGAVLAGSAIMLGGVLVGNTAISQLVGLAVAQTSTVWNNIRDAAAGDALTNGILASNTYLWNGSSFDRVRGTNGSMNVQLLGAITPADGYANPTTASQVWNLNGIFNGSTWDRWRGEVANVQRGTLLNQRQNSAANTINTITLSAVAGQSNHLYAITEATCTPAGNSSISVADGATTIFSTQPGEVPTAPSAFVDHWFTGLTGTVNTAMTISIQACGTGNNSVLGIQADRF